MTVRAWDYKEDEIVCEFYLENQKIYRKLIDILMEKLADAGYGDRLKSAVLMRISNYKAIHLGKGLSNYSKQSKEVYHKLTSK